MKILAITGTTKPDSGLGRYSKEVIEELRRQGDEVGILAAVGDRESTLRPHTSLGAMIRNMFVARRMARCCEIVHAFDAWPFAIYGWAAVWGTKKELIITGLGTYSIPPKAKSLKRNMLLRAYARAKSVLCVSNFSAQKISASGVRNEKLKIIPMGITNLSTGSAQDMSARAVELGIAPDAYPVILTVGEIKDRKGQFDTLRAADILVPQYPRLQYVMVGRAVGPYVDEIREFIGEHKLEDHTCIITNANDSALAALYERCDIVALNSTTDEESDHIEGFGLSVVEGYQFGKPAVGSTGTGVAEAIRDGETGYLAAQRDASGIAHTIIQILTEYERLSQNARTYFSEFSWEKTVAMYRAEYQHAIHQLTR